MKRYIPMLAILLLMCTNTGYAQVVDSARVIKSLAKCWHAFSYKYATIYGLEEDEIKRYAKQKVCFARDSINVYYGALYSPRYEIKKVSAENYAKNNFDCTKRSMDLLADSVFEITISTLTKPSKTGTVNKMTNVLAFDEQCIYIVVDGVTFKLVDADNKLEVRSSN